MSDSERETTTSDDAELGMFEPHQRLALETLRLCDGATYQLSTVGIFHTLQSYIGSERPILTILDEAAKRGMVELLGLEGMEVWCITQLGQDYLQLHSDDEDEG